jgi:hypothetical protein
MAFYVRKHTTHNVFLDKFKELVKVKLGARDFGSDVSIHRKSGDERVPVSTNKNIFQLHLISRVGTSITSRMRMFILAGFINAYKLRPVCEEVITRKCIPPLQ